MLGSFFVLIEDIKIVPVNKNINWSYFYYLTDKNVSRSALRLRTQSVDQHVRKPSCAARDEELVEFVGAGVEEDDGESDEKTEFHVGGPIRKVQSETDGAVKYQIFSHVGGFPDWEAHEFDEVSVLRRISVEKAELCAE